MNPAAGPSRVARGECSAVAASSHGLTHPLPYPASASDVAPLSLPPASSPPPAQSLVRPALPFPLSSPSPCSLGPGGSRAEAGSLLGARLRGYPSNQEEPLRGNPAQPRRQRRSTLGRHVGMATCRPVGPRGRAGREHVQGRWILWKMELPNSDTSARSMFRRGFSVARNFHGVGKRRLPGTRRAARCQVSQPVLRSQARELPQDFF